MRLGIDMLFLLRMCAFLLLVIMWAGHVCGGTEVELVKGESGCIQVDCNRDIDYSFCGRATGTRPDASRHAKSQHVCTCTTRHDIGILDRGSSADCNGSLESSDMSASNKL